MKSTGPILALALLALTGCVTRSYKLADKSIPPAVPLNLTSSPIETGNPSPLASGAATPAAHSHCVITLQSVIVFQGPGSWKRAAYWDEYVVSIANRGAAPLVVVDTNLDAGKGEPNAPGDLPWELEKRSKTWWEANAVRQTGTYLALGAGTAAGIGVMGAAIMSGGIFAPLTGGAAVAAGVGAAAVVGLPILAGGTIYMNVHRKHQIEAEFTRRRLVLPLALAPGETGQGSLFFRITPSPQQLTFNCRVGNEPCAVAISLTPLASLHLKPVATGSADSGK